MAQIVVVDNNRAYRVPGMSLPIATERLVLRRPTLQDVGGIVAVEADADLARQTPEIGVTPEAITRYAEKQAALEPFQVGKCFDLFIELKETASLIGLVSLVHREPSQGQIGWALHAAHRGRGYATEAGIALTRYAFTTLGLHRVYADTSADNIRSWRVMERIGLLREGVQRESSLIEGRWHDVVLYGVTVGDWESD
jgi:aminoglycoside 6'-N-acetyltransferase